MSKDGRDFTDKNYKMLKKLYFTFLIIGMKYNMVEIFICGLQKIVNNVFF